MSESPVRYTLAELRDFRDCLVDILDHLEANPITVDGQTGDFETKTNLRPNGFSMHVKWSKAAEMSILPSRSGARNVRTFIEIGYKPGLTCQLLDQLIEALEAS